MESGWIVLLVVHVTTIFLIDSRSIDKQGGSGRLKMDSTADWDDALEDGQNVTVKEVSYVIDREGRIVVNTTEPLSEDEEMKERGGKWPGNVIHYTINETDFVAKERWAILDAMEEWSLYSCVRFSNATSDNYIAFQNGERCHSQVGMKGGKQVIELDKPCRQKDIMMDVIGHAIGLDHSMTHPDGQHNRSDASPKDDSQHLPILTFWNIKKVNILQDCQFYTDCPLRNYLCPRAGFVGKRCECWCPSRTGRDIYDLCV